MSAGTAEATADTDGTARVLAHIRETLAKSSPAGAAMAPAPPAPAPPIPPAPAYTFGPVLPASDDGAELDDYLDDMLTELAIEARLEAEHYGFDGPAF